MLKISDVASFNQALTDASNEKMTTVIYVQTAPERKIAGYGYAWWDVPIAEVSESESVQKAREYYEE